MVAQLKGTNGIFDGIRILDVSHFITGPWCTEFFATQGAEVIKVEPPPFGDSMRMFSVFDKKIFPLFSILNNDKKSISLNLRKPAAQVVFKDLVAVADVVVDNLVVGTMERWGIGYEQLQAIKPDLIYVSISGFGRTGLERFVRKPAFDLIAQATSSTLDAMNIPEAPGVPLADYSAGHVAAIGLASALFHRERTGEGQLVDISMQDVMYAVNLRAHAKEFLPRAAKVDVASRILPIYNQYPTRDGHKVVIVVLTEPQWQRFCENVLQRPELEEDPRFENPIKRFDYIDDLDEIVTTHTQSRTRDELIAELEANKIPCGRVVGVDEVRDHPQLAARGTLNREFDFSKWEVPKGGATMPNPVIHYEKTYRPLQHPIGDLGAQNAEILGELLGYDAQKIKKLKRRHVI